jgi:hypothetical protein
MIAEEKDLVLLPETVTYGGGAQVACGYYFGCRVENWHCGAIGRVPPLTFDKQLSSASTFVLAWVQIPSGHLECRLAWQLTFVLGFESVRDCEWKQCSECSG